MLLKDKSKFVIGVNWTTEIRVTNEVISEYFIDYTDPYFITKPLDAQGEEFGIINGSELPNKAYSFAYFVQTLIDEESFVYINKLSNSEYYFLQVRNHRIVEKSDKILSPTQISNLVSALDFSEYPLFVNQNAADELESNESSLRTAHQYNIINIDLDSKPPKSCLLINSKSKLDLLKKHKNIILILIAFIIFLYFDSSKEEQEEFPIVADIKAAEKAKIRAQQEEFIENEVKVFTNSPSPLSLTSECLDKSLYMPVSISGWVRGDISCSNAVNSSYTRIPNTGHPNDFKDIAKSYTLNPSVTITKDGLAVGTATKEIKSFPLRNPIKLDDLPKLKSVQKLLKNNFLDLLDTGCSFTETVGYFNSPTEQPLDPDLNISKVEYHIVCKEISFFNQLNHMSHLEMQNMNFDKYNISERQTTMSYKYLAR